MFIEVSAGSSRRTGIRARAREAVADAILDAAQEVALDKGLEATSIAAISERAGVAVGTLYNYFPDREGLLLALFTARRAALAPRIAAAADATSKLPFEARLRGYVGQLFAIFEEHRAFLRLAVAAEETTLKLRPRGPTMMNTIVATLELIMRDGAAKKLFPAARAPAYARVVYGAIKGLALWRIAEGRPLTGDADLIVDGWLHGVGRPG